MPILLNIDGIMAEFEMAVPKRTALEPLMNFIVADPLMTDVRCVAYLLATIYHETAATMLPITEYGGPKYFQKYEPPSAIARDLGNTQRGDGIRYKGRGYAMITGRRNYQFFSTHLGIPLIDNPVLALNPGIAYRIISIGMHGGFFTGKKFAHYFNETTTDYVQARRIINRLDKARLIAGYALRFLPYVQTHDVAGEV